MSRPPSQYSVGFCLDDNTSLYRVFSTRISPFCPTKYVCLIQSSLCVSFFLNKSPCRWWVFKAPFMLKISPIEHHSHTFVSTRLPQRSQRPSFKTFISRQRSPSHVSHLCTNPFFISSRRSTRSLLLFFPPFLRSLSSFICRSCLSLVIVVLFFSRFRHLCQSVCESCVHVTIVVVFVLKSSESHFCQLNVVSLSLPAQ